jgi:hypothetical protein
MLDVGHRSLRERHNKNVKKKINYMNTMNTHILWVMMTACCGVMELDTMTVTITTITKKLQYYPHLGYTLVRLRKLPPSGLRH